MATHRELAPLLLAIEDDEPIVELLGTITAPLGLRTVAATDGARALELLDQERPAVITLDLVLPDIDGLAMLHLIRARPDLAEVPIIVVTALADPNLARRAYQAGASDYITKPFNVGLVEAKLRTFMRMVRLGEEVRERQRFLEDVMEHLASGLLVCDAAGRLQRLNPAGASALGLDEGGAALGRPLGEVAPGAEVMLAVDAGGGQQRLKVRTAGGERELGFSTSRLAGGGVVAVFRELAAAEVARREAEERARHAALATAARSFAHEVRNPLAAIAAAAQVITRPDADAALKQRLARAIEGEALRVTGLVREYVEQQAPVAPTIPGPGPGGTDLAALLAEIVEVNLLGNAARERVELRCDPSLPRLRADPARLKQVVLNLLLNAAAATEGGGHIVVAAAPDGKGVRLSVTDSGVGMAPPVMARIFDERYTTRPDGQGLGLTIARRLIEENGGTIAVASEPGRGAAFTVWLPAA